MSINNKQFPTKPLKGGQIFSNYGTFDTISATTLILDNTAVSGLIENVQFDGVTILNSNIYNTVIGADGAQAGYFTKLNTFDNVTFYGIGQDEAIYWDMENAIFTISSNVKFEVKGCSLLGNLEICNNDIKAENTNGDINLIPNGIGSIYLNGPVNQNTNYGNFTSNVLNGGVTFNAKNNISLTSSKGTASITTFADQTYSTKNGNYIINVDSDMNNTNITNVGYTNGNIYVTTPLPNTLKSGDVINITGNSMLSGNYTIGSIINDTKFLLTGTTNAFSETFGGSFLKEANNDILLNSYHYVKIPTDTELVFGPTCNNISGNTTGLSIETCGDLYLNVLNNKIIRVPEQTKVQFGTSGNNYINYSTTSASLDLNSSNKISLDSELLQIDSTNTKFYDPIITIGDYIVSSNDNKDRGVEFKYFNATTGSMSLGWMGYKNSTGKFAFYKNAVNTNEVITGDVANIELGTISLDGILFNTSGEIDMNCGKISKVSLLTGCSGTITISGTSDVNIETANRLYLNSTGDILIPNNTSLKFGTNGSYVREITNGNIILSANKDIQFLTKSSGSLVIPIGTQVSFDGTTIGNQKIVSNTAGDLLVTTNKDLYLTTTGGNVKLQTNTNIHFGSSSESIYGNTSGLGLLSSTSNLFLVSNSNVNISSSSGNIQLLSNVGDINLVTSLGNVRIPSTKRLVFNLSGTDNSISLNSSGQLAIVGNTANNLEISRFANINLLATSNVNLPINTRFNLGTDGSKYIYSDLNTMYIKSNNEISIESSTTNISASSFSINGNTATLDTTNVLIKDPILTLANYTLVSNDLKDRGIEYKYYNSTTASMKLGWHGYKNSTGRFTYYSDAVNSGEIITGTIGDLEISSAYIRNNIVFSNSGSLDLNCGSVVNANTISGCSNVLNLNASSITSGSLGTLNLNGASSININSTDVNINAKSKILLPYNIPLSFGSTSNSISCDSTGNMTLKSTKFIINSDVEINGTTTTIYSTVTNIQDPIISIGGVIGPVIDDNKDRGIEFKWNNGTTSKTGFFGYKDILDRFVFIKDGTNTNEVFSGSFSDVQFGNGYFSNINMTNGNITGISELSGGLITIKTTTGNINLTPTSGSNVILPYTTKIGFGTTSNSISSDTSGNLIINSTKDLSLITSIGSIILDTSSDVRIKNTAPLYFGNDNNTYILNTGNNLIVANSDGNINLTPQQNIGQVNIPANNLLTFGSTANSIYSDNSQLYLNGFNGVSINSSNVTFAGNINIMGSLSTDTYILPLGRYETLKITDARSSGLTIGNIRITTESTHYLSVGDTVTLSVTNSLPSIDGDYTVTSIVNNVSFLINKVGVNITSNGTSGYMKTDLKINQDKDVGIQVNYWKNTLNNSTYGSAYYQTGFFGYKYATDRWTFYDKSTITDYVVTGTLGNIDVNKVFTNKMSGFVLEGSMSAGSNTVVGNNFQIGGGEIQSTQIGRLSAAPARFTTLSNTVLAQLSNIECQNTLKYSIETYTLNSSLTRKDPDITKIVTIINVAGVSYIDSYGIMPTPGAEYNGLYKTIVCGSIGTNCVHTINFPTGKLIAPTQSGNPSPTKIIFKRAGQSVQLLYTTDISGGAWILLNSGAYVQ